VKDLSLSVVIPTKDRCDLLRRTLECLDKQAGYAEPFEVIVADDGSSDGTAEFLSAAPGFSSFALRSVRLPGSGAACARNRAIALAVAPRILLLGDDTFPHPDALLQHKMAAAEGDVGVQGRIEWDPAAPITPVMRYLAPEGPQFYFKSLERGHAIPYTALYASNLSAPRGWFREDPFDESFPAAAFEDTELGYRWARKGRRVVYWDAALCYHRHHYDSLEPFLRRQELAGRGALYAARLHPGMLGKTILQPLVVGALFGLRYGLRRIRRTARDSDQWDLQVRKAFLRGLLGRIDRPLRR